METLTELLPALAFAIVIAAQAAAVLMARSIEYSPPIDRRTEGLPTRRLEEILWRGRSVSYSMQALGCLFLGASGDLVAATLARPPTK